MRIYELSKELDVPSKELIALLEEQGFEVPNHMAVLTEPMLAFIYDLAGKKPPGPNLAEADVAELTEEERKLKYILAQGEDDSSRPASRSRGGRYKKFRKQKREEGPEPAEEAPHVLVLEPTSLSEVARRVRVSANDLILALLKQGIVCAKNQLLPLPVVEKIARLYEVETVLPEKVEFSALKFSADSKGTLRPPVVVVVGHVDHGKTTFLDYVRKTRVTEREKGGITQHLGAYTVPTTHGNIVFLDTPGHEAFGKIRIRGLNIADLAILVVAADDGIMPQTVEAIKHAQAANIPIIVAINKIDKSSPAQIEKIKRELSQYNLLPEEWGGQVVVAPISAKEGTGVDSLLEVVALQAEIMELKADATLQPKGFVLEAKMEKGLGAVATIILHDGTIKLGQYFVCGKTFGRVNSLTDEHGKQLKEVGPAKPVQVAGFDQLPEAGDMFEEVSQSEYSKARSGKRIAAPVVEAKPLVSDLALNVIIKADNKSSKEAIVDILEKINKKSEEELQILFAGVGSISESDVNLARDTSSVIYGFNVKYEPSAASFAKKQRTDIRLFDIIYKLAEDAEVLLESKKIAVEVLKEVGQAEVRKVFDIKGVGVIAGSYVQSGRFIRNGVVEAWRNNEKIAQAPIKSLERDRKSVKEVHTGFEFAFLTEGYNDWQVGDIAKCFILSKE